jgi:lipopolysaccharide biosynthesis protein
MKNIPEIIAFYLPQYHPIPENDVWWGKGFTEWTNVGKAKPLFKGHNQPRVPTELGYYDLRLPIIREQQAQMAKDAGVTAFCYWHYWFGDGRRLMANIFDDVLHSGKPDFPFCLGWANHSWYAKNWNSDGSSNKNLLIEQKYPRLHDQKLHFEFLLTAFKDKRYVKINGSPLLYIFDPHTLPLDHLENFRLWTKSAGFPDIFLVANISNNVYGKNLFLDLGYNAVSFQRHALQTLPGNTIDRKILRRIQKWSFLLKGKLAQRPPFIADYSKSYKNLVTEIEFDEDVIPSLMPQWDHTPRSGWNGTLFVNANPENFYLHAKEVLKSVRNKEKKIIFLKSWNEWGEGNFMEPDITFGRGFINSLRRAIDEQQGCIKTSI